MISVWWIHLIIVSGNYVIQPGAIEQVTVMTNKRITMEYIYARFRIKKPPNIVSNLKSNRIFRLIIQ